MKSKRWYTILFWILPRIIDFVIKKIRERRKKKDAVRNNRKGLR